VAVLPKPLDEAAFVQLKAEAIKEASGADVGVVRGMPPGWVRFKDAALPPAGPVTRHDLALANGLYPEFITVCELTGEKLLACYVGQGKGAQDRCLGSTVVPDKNHPNYKPGLSLTVAEIDPNKTYRMACDFTTALAYGHKGKPPPVLYVKNLKEFMEHPNISLSVSKAWLTDLDVTTALIARLQKEKKDKDGAPAAPQH